MGNDTGNKKAASVDAAAPAPHEPWKVRVKRWVRNPLLQLVLLATVLLVFVTVSVVTYRTTASDEYTSVESYLPDTPDRIRLTLRMIGADLVNHRILMSVRTFPEGRFRAEQNTPSQNISVEMDNILRKWWWLVGMPIPILPYDTAVNVAGDVNMFPFDVSSATFTVRAYGFNDPSLVIPVGIQFINNVATLSVTTSVLPVPGAGDLSVSTTISISRLTTVKVYAMFTCIISWVLALAVTLLFIDSAWSKHRVEAPILALAIALVFALPALRNSNPGIPPIGTLYDCYSFFIALFLISLIAAAFIFYYVLRASAAPAQMAAAQAAADAKAADGTSGAVAANVGSGAAAGYAGGTAAATSAGGAVAAGMGGGDFGIDVGSSMGSMGAAGF